MAIIVSSIQDGSGYDDNMASLRYGLQNGTIKFQGQVKSDEPEFDFDNKRRVYDFTRSAKTRISNYMAAYLHRKLPEVTVKDFRKVFDRLFNYYTYEEDLKYINGHLYESMKMLVFDEDHEEYVAHVCFNSTSRRTAVDQYTVDAVITCQRYTYFNFIAADLVKGMGQLRL